jgi:hypothetical protein
MWIRRKTIIAAVAAVLGVAFSAGVFLTSGRDPAGKPAARPGLLSPFTGEPVAAPGPVLAVKIDNVARARTGPRRCRGPGPDVARAHGVTPDRLRPTTPARIRPIDTSFAADTASPRSTMPTVAAPAAPIPVQTA